MATVWIAYGFAEGTQRRVSFGLDHRPGRDLAELIESDGPVLCDVMGWQMITPEPAAQTPYLRSPLPETEAERAASTQLAANHQRWREEQSR